MIRLKSLTSTTGRTTFSPSRVGWVLLTFLIISGLLLTFEHRAHLLTRTAGLAVLLGLCVIMLAVMWRSHGPTNTDKGGRP